MATGRFEFELMGDADEIADYLVSLAAALSQGHLSLESGARALRLSPAGEINLGLKVGVKPSKGKIKLAMGWRRRESARAGDLHIDVASRQAPVANL